MSGELRADARENLRKILAAAGEVFAEHGLDSTLAQVAARAGVGVGTLYRRFASKDELVFAVFSDRLEALVAVADEALEGDDAWTSFLTYLQQSVTTLAQDRGLRELVTSAPLAKVSPTFLHAIEDTSARLAERLERLTAWAKAEGGLSERFAAQDIPLVTSALLDAHEYGGDVRQDLDQRLLELLLAGLRPQARASQATPPLSDAEIGRILRRRS